ncbi:olfactory receptor 52K1-like [Astyanax mexicanus]|uniref:Olfactory receptor 52K1-like n=1 Tax=Astyanax mexicanus TaxID=7994 RepID=A0A8T2L0H1_ASTMX|nr:olfactory receptor 52K1-like [Astyanax mexicanus]KAG9265083.1 olfactory receptor 52K1-like [Astyanax mexicanus]
MLDVSVQNISFTQFKLNGFYALGEWRRLLFIPYFLMFVLAILANSVLLYVIIANRALHSPMFVLIGLMAVVDLGAPVFFVPHMLLSFLFNWNGISLTGCLIQMFCIHYSGSSQSTLLLCMALDRYFAICRPLLYHEHMELSNILKYMIMPLIRNVVLITTIICLAGRLSYCSTDVIDHCFCEHMALVNVACGDTSINNLVGLLSAFIVITLDFLLIIFSYIIIFTSVLKSGKANYKALNTCITHIIVITFSLIFALMAFMSYRLKSNLSSNSHVFLSTMYLLFPSCCNPIIYGLRTKEIRHHILKLIKHKKTVPF